MRKRVLQSCAMLVLGLASMQMTASAQERRDAEGSPGLEGVWFAVVTPSSCQQPYLPTGAPTFRGLYRFGHDGSLTNEAAFLVAPPTGLPPRSSGVGAWQHAEARTYTGVFRFFRYKPADGTFLSMRRVATSIFLNGDQFSSVDFFQDFNENNMPDSGVGSSGCNTVSAQRVN